MRQDQQAAYEAARAKKKVSEEKGFLQDHHEILHQLQVESLSTRQVVLDRVEAHRAEYTLKPRTLAAAATTWMVGTFLLCYIVLPVLIEQVGLRDAQLWNLPSEILGFGAAWAVVMGFLAARRPTFRLDRDPVARSDLFMAATGGGLLTWAFLHNAVPGLLPFDWMPVSFFMAFLACNIVENLLFGVVLASVAKTRKGALALGAGFQAVLMVLASSF